jgi:hypothetical protein
MTLLKNSSRFINMGIDYSDIINGIIIFLLSGLCATFFAVIIFLWSRNQWLAYKVEKLNIMPKKDIL